MKKLATFMLSLSVLGCMMLPAASVKSTAATNKYTTTPTGYETAEDVVYKKVGENVVNWGARGEDCTFLTTYAEDFYTGSYVYETLSKNKGGTTQTNAKDSALYDALQSMMSSKQDHVTSYDETRSLYKYTDCLRNNTSTISSFYSGKSISGTWDSGSTWNREHTWPKSKGSGSSLNDIMMLRPTASTENSSRGNTAYGQSTGYCDPDSWGTNVRGDCARIMLFVYVRWGNTSRMWGSSGVMENMSVMLRWMQEDPVDTWEMGRNDAVESITGTRNVFVDYPEYAWLLFGQTMPKMSTPSGIASGKVNSSSSSTSSNSSSKEESSSVEDSSEEVSSSEEESSSVGDSSEVLSSSSEEESSSKEENSSMEDSSEEISSSEEKGNSSKDESSSVDDSSEDVSASDEESSSIRDSSLGGGNSSNKDSSFNSSINSTANGGLGNKDSHNDESVRNSTSDKKDSSNGEDSLEGTPSCLASVYSVSASVMLGIVCAFAIKKRTLNK